MLESSFAMGGDLPVRRLGFGTMKRIELFQLRPNRPHCSPRRAPWSPCRVQGEGKIGRIGLSQVSVPEIEAARAITPIATVQNLYNISDRSAKPVLEYCEREASASSHGSR